MRSGLSDSFEEALRVGFLNPLLKRVQNDHSLMLCTREGYINIYYRGGNLIELKEKPDGSYEAFFNKNYITENYRNHRDGYRNDEPLLMDDDFFEQTIAKANENNVKKLIQTILLKKEIMDFHFSDYFKTEREFQQLVARENNYPPISNDTDYFIADIELVIDKTRFDMLAFKWPSTSSDRRKDNVRLALVEMKYGQGAFSSSSGIYKHFKDMESFLSIASNISNLAEMAEKQINQLNKLGLLAHTRVKDRDFEVDKSQVEIIFILANHKPSSGTLLSELKNIQREYAETDNLKLRFFTANSAGYGMYGACMMDIDKYIKFLQDQQ